MAERNYEPAQKLPGVLEDVIDRHARRNPGQKEPTPGTTGGQGSFTGNDFESHPDLPGLDDGTYKDGEHTFLVPFHEATADPTSTDDGYKLGTIWIRTDTNEGWVMVDNAASAAVWQKIGGGGDAPDDEPTGFPNRTDSNISRVDGTRTFTIQPAAASFDIYFSGRKVTYNSAQNVVWPSTEGIHFAYFDYSDDTLKTTTTFSVALILQHVLVAIWYWDTTNSKTIYFGEERHGLTMDGATHLYLHVTEGARYQPDGGLALSNMIVDGNGSLDTHSQLATTAGTIWDEDIEIDIAANGLPANLGVMYRLGTTNWRLKTADNFPVIYNGTAGYTGTRCAYNLNTGGTWSLAENGNGDYFLIHLFATNDLDEGFIVVLGQDTYANRAAARAGATTEILSLFREGLPFAEFVAVATVICQTASSYSNTPKNRFRSTEDGLDYVDWRGKQLAGAGGVAVASHPQLTGLNSGPYLDGGHEHLIPVVLSASTDPTASDDGYKEGTVWVRQDTNAAWLMTDNTATAAVWQSLAGSNLWTRSPTGQLSPATVDDFVVVDLSPGATNLIAIAGLHQGVGGTGVYGYSALGDGVSGETDSSANNQWSLVAISGADIPRTYVGHYADFMQVAVTPGVTIYTAPIANLSRDLVSEYGRKYMSVIPAGPISVLHQKMVDNSAQHKEVWPLCGPTTDNGMLSTRPASSLIRFGYYPFGTWTGGGSYVSTTAISVCEDNPAATPQATPWYADHGSSMLVRWDTGPADNYDQLQWWCSAQIPRYHDSDPDLQSIPEWRMDAVVISARLMLMSADANYDSIILKLAGFDKSGATVLDLNYNVSAQILGMGYFGQWTIVQTPYIDLSSFPVPHTWRIQLNVAGALVASPTTILFVADWIAAEQWRQ